MKQEEGVEEPSIILGDIEKGQRSCTGGEGIGNVSNEAKEVPLHGGLGRLISIPELGSFHEHEVNVGNGKQQELQQESIAEQQHTQNQAQQGGPEQQQQQEDPTRNHPQESDEYSEPFSFGVSNREGSNDSDPLLESGKNEPRQRKNRQVRFPQHDTKREGNRGLYRGVTHRPNQGQHVSIRNADMCAAMDENQRRRNRFKIQCARWFGRDYEEEDEEEGMKVSMHGRFMVQPSVMALHQLNESIESGDDDDDGEKKRQATQYRLTTVKKNRKKNGITIPGMYEDTSSLDPRRCCFFCPDGDRVASNFLHWSFRSPFIVVFGTAAIGWLSMTFIFGFVIWVIGFFLPECIGGVDYHNTTAPFLDAYQLSWTTFSTVGYGLIYPQISVGYQPIHMCTAITVVTTFESFVGVLFSSLCAALMFAKVGRVQSFAQVTFSDPVVIRYGTGVITDGNDDDDDDDDDDNSSQGRKDPLTTRIPCPVLEFRIFNRLNAIPGGEIIDATLNMVASIDASQADPALQANRGRRKRGKKKRGPTRASINSIPLRNQRDTLDSNKASSEEDERYDVEQGEVDHSKSPAPQKIQLQQSAIPRDAPQPLRGPAPSLFRRSSSQPQLQVGSHQSPAHQRHMHAPNSYLAGKGKAHHAKRQNNAGHGRGLMRGIPHLPPRQETGSFFVTNNLNHVSARKINNQAFEEDPSGKLMPKKILSKLDVESPDHPFFRRNWLVRHTLDMNSLLLKPHVRQMLRRNHGFWPKELNNYESIRASVQFDQILVSLSGTSNADANSVFAQHVYHMVDVNIGYRFVNALYRDPQDGGLRVDGSLINDVMEQAGGGGEPLQNFLLDKPNEMYVL